MATLLCFVCLASCAQTDTRQDIEDKLQGSWTGVIKNFQLKVTNETDVLIDKHNFFLKRNVFIDNQGKRILKPNSDQRFNRYRIIIYNGDTIMERKPSLTESPLKEPTYSKLHFVNKDEIRFYFLFRQNEKMLLGLKDNKDGYYLRRTKKTSEK